ncbi:MAG TPA: hypothetical protein PK098_10815, partial [Phycisphaerales bacterium]|nr:hypothetical protein [Phycisphaerales bacterium]
MIRRVSVTLCIVSLVVAPASGAVIFSKWVGPATGNWNVAGNWDPAAVPQNGVNTYVVRIDDNRRQNTIVTHTTGTTTLDGLIIDAGDTLIQNNSTSFVILDFVTNDGLWQMNSAGNVTDIQIGGNEVLFDGGGTVSMSSNLNNRFYGTGGLRRLINGSNHTIRGSGQIGFNANLKLTNDGMIDANQAIAMVVDMTDGAGNFNNGVMQSSLSGTLTIIGTTLDNTNGVIRAIGNGLTRLESSSILGGELRTEDSGEMRVQGVTLLEAVTVNGALTQVNSAVVDLVNGIEINGEWRMNSAGNQTDARLLSDVTLSSSSTGEVVMSNNIQNRFYGSGALRRLTIDPTITIRGSGQIGFNANLKLTNDGLIDATQSNALTVDMTDGAGNFNNGVMQSSLSGTLTIIGTTLDNTNGVIRAIGNGLTRLESSSILGGELRTEDSGEMRVQGVTLLEAVTVNGALTQVNSAVVDLVNGIEINGEWRMNSAGNQTDARLLSDVTLSSSSTGEVVMSNNIQNRFYGSGALRRLTIDPTITIRGSGQIGFNANLKLTNDGLIDATQSNALTVDMTDGAGNFNNGVMQSSLSGTLTIIGTTLDNTNGVIRAIGNGLTRLESSSILGGELRTEDSGEMRVQGVTLLEAVTVNGALTQVNSAVVDLVNGIEINGEWRMNSAGNQTDARLLSDVTLSSSSTGEVVMSNNIQNRFYGSGALRRLTIGPDVTVRGSGQLGVNFNFALTNHGSIIANQSSGITIDLTDSETFLNTGLLHVTGSGSMTIQPSGMNQQGLVLIDATRTLSRLGHYVQTSGTTTTNGVLSVSAGNQLQ